MIQRVSLHRDEWSEVLAIGDALPDVFDVVGPIRAIDLVGDATPLAAWRQFGGSFRDAGKQLEYWFELPGAVVAQQAGPDRLGSAVRTALASDGAPPDPLLDLAALAAAWWVGFFAVLRHRGVHHETLHPVEAPVPFSVLVRTAQLVALGVTVRLLADAATNPSERTDAYLWAVSQLVAAEREVPALLAELNELRLVDLTSLTVPWRGQFAKYGSGAGPGQVE